jgi:hypothetical protein
MKNKMLPGPRQDFLEKHPKELAVQTALLKKVTAPIVKLRDRTLKWMNDGIDLANDMREVGLYYNEIKESLPGKKMTIDFFRQYALLFTDTEGKQIPFEQLEYFGKLATVPEFERIKGGGDGTVLEGFNVMLSYKQAMFGATGFLELEAERPPQQAHDVNYYAKVLEKLEYSSLKAPIEKMEADPNFGPIEQWPSERREKFWIQVKPMVDFIETLKRKLGKAAA